MVAKSSNWLEWQDYVMLVYFGVRGEGLVGKTALKECAWSREQEYPKECSAWLGILVTLNPANGESLEGNPVSWDAHSWQEAGPVVLVWLKRCRCWCWSWGDGWSQALCWPGSFLEVMNAETEWVLTFLAKKDSFVFQRSVCHLGHPAVMVPLLLSGLWQPCVPPRLGELNQSWKSFEVFLPRLLKDT